MADKSVLVTGASTGIGKACALRMDERGWSVFAGVRKEADADELRSAATGPLEPVTLDVTDGASIEAAAALVERRVGDSGLDGLVNNAGITVQGPLEYLPLDDLRRQFEVNVTGQLAVTQAFLPLIRRATGRIVFMGSVGGRAPSLPLIGPYTSSKYALEALSESLRLELLPWDIKVSIVEPGSIATPIWEKGDATFDGLFESLPAEGRERYGEAMKRGRRIGEQAGRRGIPPDKVADRVEHALTASTPRIHYLVGFDAKARALLESQIPKPVRDRVVSRVMGYRRKKG